MTEVFVADPKLATERIRAALEAADRDNYPQQALVHMARWDVEAILNAYERLREKVEWAVEFESMSKTVRMSLLEALDD